MNIDTGQVYILCRGQFVSTTNSLCGN